MPDRIRTTVVTRFGSPLLGESATVPAGTEFDVTSSDEVTGCVWVDVEKDQGGHRQGLLYRGEYEAIEPEATS